MHNIEILLHHLLLTATDVAEAGDRLLGVVERSVLGGEEIGVIAIDKVEISAIGTAEEVERNTSTTKRTEICIAYILLQKEVVRLKVIQQSING